MSFLVIGINHRTAPVEIREKVVFAGDELGAALRELASVAGVREALIVSTCNRTELYALSDGDERALLDWLAHWHDLAAHRLDISDSVYRLHEAAAIKHVFAVASGLDSLVLGEPQILGQLKDAYRAALEASTTGAYLNRLMQTAFSVAKRVRTSTRIGASAVSVASAAVSLARTVFEKFENHSALLVGAGETIALAARHLHAHGLRRIVVANRSTERAQELAKEFGGSAISLDALDVHLPDADIVITSTASPTPVVTYAAVRAAIRARKRKPIFMVDIAVPRDIEARVATLDDVYLFTIDDLQNVVNENIQSRREAARGADEILDAEIAAFLQQLKALDVAPTIRRLRAEAETLRAVSAAQARRMLAAGRNPAEVVEFLATTLTNRLMHLPSHQLRQAAERDDAELIRAVRSLFGSNIDTELVDDIGSDELTRGESLTGSNAPERRASSELDSDTSSRPPRSNTAANKR
jgi:glutamyl-tRNA reductase